MIGVTRRQAILGGLIGSTAAADGRSASAVGDARASWLPDIMEQLRREVPPPREPREGLGRSIEQGGARYTTAHLHGVASRLGVQTRADGLVLLTYLKDADLKLRFIAVSALNRATGAYPNGWPAGAVTELGSEEHRQIMFRFIELIDRLPAEPRAAADRGLDSDN